MYDLGTGLPLISTFLMLGLFKDLVCLLCNWTKCSLGQIPFRKKTKVVIFRFRTQLPIFSAPPLLAIPQYLDS